MMAEHIVFGDWRDLRGAIERAAPEWASSNEQTRKQLWDFAEAVIAEYEPLRVQCVQCKAVIPIRGAYRCADCHAHCCATCIRPHFEEARTTPANLNAPDKQEGEGVEGGNLLLDWYNAQARVVWAAWCAADDSSDDFNPETHVAVPNDSFSDLAAALEALDALVPADSQNVGTGALNDEVRAVLARTLPSNEALAGDDRNGVEEYDALAADLERKAQEADGNTFTFPIMPCEAERIVTALRARTPQADEADVERVARLVEPGTWEAIDAAARGGPAAAPGAGLSSLQIARKILSTMTTRPAGGEEVGWTSDMSAAPSSCMIFTAKWGVTEGLRFDDGTWGVAAFNGQRIAAEPLYWRHKPNAPGAAALTKPAALPKDTRHVD